MKKKKLILRAIHRIFLYYSVKEDFCIFFEDSEIRRILSKLTDFVESQIRNFVEFIFELILILELIHSSYRHVVHYTVIRRQFKA